MPINAVSVLCAQLTRDLFAIAKFLLPLIDRVVLYLEIVKIAVCMSLEVKLTN